MANQKPTLVPLSISELQLQLENWWNANPEMRHVEILCGNHLRVCVRLYEIVIDRTPTSNIVDDDGVRLVGQAEAGRLEEAVTLALADYKSRSAARK